MSRTDLFCLPPAGAGPSLYRGWRRQSPCVKTPGLPGRESRIREPVPPSLNALADLLADEIAPSLPESYAWFGYSMGAALAYEISRRLPQYNAPLPRAFIVLASNPPDALIQDPVPLHSLESAAFWEELARIGGTPDEVLSDPEFRAFFEPLLRSDFRNCETYAPAVFPAANSFRLECPVHVFVADQDHMVSRADAAGWGKFTTGPLTVHLIKGGHMLPASTMAQLLPTILDQLSTRQPA